MIMKVFTTHLDHNLIVSMIKMRIIKKQQNSNIDTKPLNVFDYLKSLRQEAKDLIDEIKDADDDIDIYKLAFIGSNRLKFNFNIFRMSLNFLSAIYNGEISLKEAEFIQRNLKKKIEQLRFGYKPKNIEEKKEIDVVLIQANDMLEYRDKIIEEFKDGTFSSEYLKKSDAAAYDYVLKDVKNFIQKIESIAENINLSLSDYKIFLDYKNLSDLKDRKKMTEKEKKVKVQMKH